MKAVLVLTVTQPAKIWDSEPLPVTLLLSAHCFLSALSFIVPCHPSRLLSSNSVILHATLFVSGLSGVEDVPNFLEKKTRPPLARPEDFGDNQLLGNAAVSDSGNNASLTPTPEEETLEDTVKLFSLVCVHFCVFEHFIHVLFCISYLMLPGPARGREGPARPDRPGQ